MLGIGTIRGIWHSSLSISIPMSMPLPGLGRHDMVGGEAVRLARKRLWVLKAAEVA